MEEVARCKVPAWMKMDLIGGLSALAAASESKPIPARPSAEDAFAGYTWRTTSVSPIHREGLIDAARS